MAIQREQRKIKKPQTTLQNIHASIQLLVRTFLNHLAGFTSRWCQCLSGSLYQTGVLPRTEYKSHFDYLFLVILMLFLEFLKTLHPDDEVSYSAFVWGAGVGRLFLNKYSSSLHGCGK